MKDKIINLIFKDCNYEYMKNLKKWGYYSNLSMLQQYYYAWCCGIIKHKCGIDLTPNVAGPGLHTVHRKVVTNAFSKTGENCKILSDVTIGITGKENLTSAPVIGANAVVIKNITEQEITIARIPAKKINDIGSDEYI